MQMLLRYWEGFQEMAGEAGFSSSGVFCFHKDCKVWENTVTNSERALAEAQEKVKRGK